MSDATEKVRMTVVALGNVILTDRKLGLQFARAEKTPEGTWALAEGRPMNFTRKVKRLMGGSPGSMYTVDAAPDGSSIFTGTAAWEGRWPDAKECAIWQARSAAIAAEHLAQLSVKEKEKRSELFESLATARQAYRRAVGVNRQQLLAIIVEHITRG